MTITKPGYNNYDFMSDVRAIKEVIVEEKYVISHGAYENLFTAAEKALNRIVSYTSELEGKQSLKNCCLKTEVPTNEEDDDD